MTAINFPDSPSNGDTHVVGGVIYTYDSTETKWKTTINSNAFLPLTGGTLSGNLNMGTNDLTVGDVTASGTASLSGLTYPTSDGTTGQYLQTDGAGALSFQTVTAPAVLQVLQDIKTDADSTTNSIANSVTIAGLSQNITMSAATNRVLVMAQVSIGGEGDSEAALSLYRGTTQIYLGDAGTGVRASAPVGMAWSTRTWQGNSASIVFVDTPGTGTHTYSVRFGGNGGTRIWVNRTGRNGASDPLTASSITLMELTP